MKLFFIIVFIKYNIINITYNNTIVLLNIYYYVYMTDIHSYLLHS